MSHGFKFRRVVRAALKWLASHFSRANGLVAFAAVVTTSGFAADEAFDFSILRQRAQALATKPYVPPAKDALPEWLRKLSYDEHRIIEFDANRSLWRRENLPFQVQFFHPGSYFHNVVQISEVHDGRAQPIPFQRDFFNYHQLKTGVLP